MIEFSTGIEINSHKVLLFADADRAYSQSLEQPTIELLATEVFGFAQTGAREPLNVSAAFRGSPLPTFQSGVTRSHWFGQVLYATQPGWVYLDEPSDGLQFMGTDNTVQSFTMGFYYSGIATYHSWMWTILNTHNFSPTTDMYTFPEHWRLMASFSIGSLNMNNVDSTNTVFLLDSFALTTEQQTQFNHYAFQ